MRLSCNQIGTLHTCYVGISLIASHRIGYCFPIGILSSLVGLGCFGLKRKALDLDGMPVGAWGNLSQAHAQGAVSHHNIFKPYDVVGAHCGLIDYGDGLVDIACIDHNTTHFAVEGV